MQKTKVDLDKVNDTIDDSLEKLEEGLKTAKLSKKGKEDVANDLKEVIAIAEKLKASL